MSDLSFRIDMGDLLIAGVHQFLAEQAFHLEEGCVERVARAYSVPLVVALPDERGYAVLTSRNQIESFFRHKREGFLSAGMPTPRLHVSQVRETSPGRISAVVEWHYATRDGHRIGQSRTRQFLERRGGTFSIQMVEFEQVTYPQIGEWFGNELQRTRPPRPMIH